MQQKSELLKIIYQVNGEYKMSNIIINSYNHIIPQLPVTLDGTPQTQTGMTDTSLSVSISVGDYTNKALIFCMTQQSGSTTSVKVGTNSFVNMIKQQGAASGTGSQRSEIWYLLANSCNVVLSSLNQRVLIISWLRSSSATNAVDKRLFA